MFGSLLGKALGGLAGKKLGKLLGNEDLGRNIGEMAGGAGGAMLPFKKGGRVKGKRGKAIPIMAHGGEYVLPTSVKPTKAQVKAVNALKKPKKVRKAKKMK